MRLAQHLTVFERSIAAATPRRHVIRVHLRQLPYPRGIFFMPERAHRTIRAPRSLRLRRLPSIRQPLCPRIKQSNLQQLRLRAVAQHVLEYPARIGDVFVCIQPIDRRLQLRRIIFSIAIRRIQPPPIKPAHFLARVDKIFSIQSITASKCNRSSSALSSFRCRLI